MSRPLSEDNDIDAAMDCIAMDLLWADPASAEHNDLMGKHGLPNGFAPNLDRGGDACVFGSEAVRTFTKATSCDFILRAHQPPDKGIRYQAGAKVITVFSSSHYCGMNNSAALIVVQSQQLDIGKRQRGAPLLIQARDGRRLREGPVFPFPSSPSPPFLFSFSPSQ